VEALTTEGKARSDTTPSPNKEEETDGTAEEDKEDAK